MTRKQITLTIATGLLVAACGGGGSSTNVAPRLDAIADTTVTANETSAPIAVTVADRNVNAVMVTATSSDETVIANSAISIAGARGNFTLTVTPTPDTLGMSTLTVAATDRGGLTSQTSFIVTVEVQTVSFAQTFRDTFADGPNDEPRDVNSRSFDDDAGNDDFADLLN